MKGILAILMAGIMVATMIAPAMGNNANTEATVGNADPVVVLVKVSDPTSMNLCPTNTAVTVNATVSDANGVGDISSVDITNINPAILGVGVPINMTWVKNNSATEAVYTGTISLPCCTGVGDYNVTVTVSDGTGSDTGHDDLTVPSSKGLSLNFDKVAFSGAPGANNVTGTASSSGSAVSAKVNSTGNTAINVSVLAADLQKDGTGPEAITGDNMEANLKSLGWEIVEPVYTFNTNLGCQIDASALFRLDIPSGMSHGSYSGDLTISAV